MFEYLLYLYVISVGFVCAGLIATFSEFITGRPLSFVISRDISPIYAFPAVIIRVFGGPFILLRNSIRGARIEKRAVHWLIISTSIATVWSFICGVFVLETVLQLKF